MRPPPRTGGTAKPILMAAVNAYLIFSANFVGVLGGGRELPGRVRGKGPGPGSARGPGGPRNGQPSSDAKVMHRWGQSLRPPRGPSKATGHVGPYMPVRHLSPQVWKRSGGYVFNPSTQDRYLGNHKRSHILPAQAGNELGDSVDSIDLSQLRPPTSSESNSHAPIIDLRRTQTEDPSEDRLVTEEMKHQNSMHKFDAFGDYEYVDSSATPQALTGQPLGPQGHRGHPRPLPDEISNNGLDRQNRRTVVVYQSQPGGLERGGPFDRRLPNQFNTPFHSRFRPPPRWPPPRREDTATFQKLQNIGVPYHDPAAGNQAVPVRVIQQAQGSSARPPRRPPPKGVLGTLLSLTGLEGTGGVAGGAFIPQSQPQPTGLGSSILSLVGLGGQPQDLPVAGEVSYEVKNTDYSEYEYGDYSEGIGVPAPRPLTIGQRVVKWFDGFKVTAAASKPLKRKQTKGPPAPSFLDYNDYEVGEDQNLVFYNEELSNGNKNKKPQNPVRKPGPGNTYDFNDVIHSLKNNETGLEVAKKFLSAAASISNRADFNPVFMMWTVPTALFAIFGTFYFVSALAIVGFKYASAVGATDASQAISLLPIVAVFTVPLVAALIIVSTRASVNGKLDVSRVLKGDFENSMRSDFDGVNFVMDTLYGSSAIIGIAWLLSIAV